MYKEDHIKGLVEFIESQLDELIDDPNITSIGIGSKTIKGKRTDSLGIVYTVNEKVQSESLRKVESRPIPGLLRIRGESMPTDVIQRRYHLNHLVNNDPFSSIRTSTQEILQPGISIGIRDGRGGSTGTLGCFVRDEDTGQLCILSNWHVLKGTKGSNSPNILQPGISDLAMKRQLIGQFLRGSVTINGDCAISSVIDPSKVNPSILGLDVVPKSFRRAVEGERVVKSGRTTGVTHGEVSIFEQKLKIKLPDFSGTEKTHWINVFEIALGKEEPFPPPDGEISLPGDSGSVWMIEDANGKPTDTLVGLHMGWRR